MKLNCPVEYALITESTKGKNGMRGIDADLIETIAYRSANPSFQTTEFRIALSDFRTYKFRTPNRKTFDLNDEVEAIKKRLHID